MGEIQVSFAFLSSRTVDYCCNAGSSADLSSSASQFRIPEVSSRRVALVKLLDFESGCSRAFRASCSETADVGAVFDALRRSENSNAVEFVGFELMSFFPGNYTHLNVSRVLSPHDPIPDFFSCQRVRLGQRLKFSVTRWLVINTFVCSNDGELFVGHVPFLVPLTAEDVSKASILSAVARILNLNTECEALLRNCIVLACTNDGRKITIDEPLQDGCGADQISIVYNAADIGDIVVVSAQWHASSHKGPAPIIQGVVTRRFVQDGMLLFDVKEMDTAVVMERLSCTQLVPL
ncbi:hypothetical protein ABB37_02236 [Leptomonas pyrrhocoris]|uniref:Uncharacterized protein n=1 Tax=Leptomonas pyrrhocoris TaxID=157538 RepID=A0A0M9G7T1_LEPPY|nr:hypothetical protein ABB37_02236 [Leptomonas pyrrhocoris]KPA84166.1 hypothetical protein ABB37_02236 [Leptomonas pyrrhocoris]|eukprot:XP_015662605.1 hypothetical protein ABB37_02236 [Leptomonas pyrrhocoris]